MTLRIAQDKTEIDSTAEQDAELTAAFARQHALLFDDVFAPDVQAMLDRAFDEAVFTGQDIPKVGLRLFEQAGRMTSILRFVLKRRELCDWIGRIAGTPKLVEVSGAVARFTAGTSQQLYWHDDIIDEPRQLGVTINLGREPYDGGRFEIRRVDTAETVFHYDHQRRFSMLVFPVRKGLVHRVTPVTRGGPRTVYGGWFLSAPEPAAAK